MRERPADRHRRTPVEVVVHVDAAALGGAGGASDLPVPTVRRLCCDAGIVPLIENSRGAALGVGRRQRTVPTGSKRAIFSRDQGCVFPGRHHTRFIDAHHLTHWADGGDTSLDNLVCLCTTHHCLVHEGGFAIQRNGDGMYYFTHPDGRTIDVAHVPRRDRAEDARPVYRLARHSVEWGMPPVRTGSVRRQRLRMFCSVSLPDRRTRAPGPTA